MATQHLVRLPIWYFSYHNDNMQTDHKRRPGLQMKRLTRQPKIGTTKWIILLLWLKKWKMQPQQFCINCCAYFWLLWYDNNEYLHLSLQGGRVCYTAHPRNGEGVISLKTAGDISVPQNHHHPQQGPTRRGLIVPQQPPNPPTIIPLTHAR